MLSFTIRPDNCPRRFCCVRRHRFSEIVLWCLRLSCLNGIIFSFLLRLSSAPNAICSARRCCRMCGGGGGGGDDDDVFRMRLNISASCFEALKRLSGCHKMTMDQLHTFTPSSASQLTIHLANKASALPLYAAESTNSCSDLGHRVGEQRHCSKAR